VPALLLATGPAGSAVAGSRTDRVTGTCAGWTPVSVPLPPSTDGSLAAVSGTSSTDVWAVGFAEPTSHQSLATLAEHFDGAEWAAVPTPSQGSVSWLSGVAAVAPDDAWAVGTGVADGGGFDPIALHWDGSTWSLSLVAVPPTGGLFAAVAAAGPDDVWAVGNAGLNSTARTLVEHFNGTDWRIVSSPHRRIPSRLEGIAVAGPNDAWAVGQSAAAVGAPRMLREHWDGQRWSVSEDRAGKGNLAGVAADGPNDVWAVGQGDLLTLSVATPFDGTSWRSTHTRNPSPIEDELMGASAVSRTEAWAAGAFYDQGLRLLIERWDGSRWHVAFRGDHGILNGATTLPDGGSWVVGSLTAGPAPFAAEHC
jgi:hypothetical protein